MEAARKSNAEGLTVPKGGLGSRGSFFLGRRESLWSAVYWRFGIAFGVLIFTTVLVYLGRGGYTDSQGDPGTMLTPLDCFYFATVTLSTTGYGDIVPSSDWARFISAVIITPLRIIFLIVLVGSTLEVLTARTRAEYREARWRKKVRNHTIVIGFGVKGRAAVQALLDNGGDAAQIVVISTDRDSVEEATTMGCVGVVGSGRRDDILLRAGIERAARVVIALDADDTSILVTLSCRRLAPNATIVTAARELQNVAVLRQSGADSVITTAESAGRLMGISLVSPTAGAILEDLIEPGQGLEVKERPVDPTEYGIPVGDLADRGAIVLAVVRQGHVHRFDVAGDMHLQAADRVVVIQHATNESTRAKVADEN